MLSLGAGVALVALHAVWYLLAAGMSAAVLPPAGEVLAGQAPYSFAVIGDSRGNTAVFERVLAGVRADGADLILHGGDLVRWYTRYDFEWVLHELHEEGLTVPFCAVPGNHDIDEEATDEAVRYRHYSRAFGPRQYWFSYANALFVAFDDAAEAASPADIEWLDRTLGMYRDRYPLCFVFFHVPLRDPRHAGGHALQAGAEGLGAVLSKHRVNAVFASHVHGYLEDTVNGIPCYITGGGGAELDDPEAGYHYLICSVALDGSFQVKKRNVEAVPDEDYLEYIFRVRFPADVSLFLGTGLALTGIALSLGRRARRRAGGRPPS